MSAPLVPARLEFAADGTPYSAAFGDVYHSAAGGVAQARHVFLGGNALPGRWRGRRTFTILETGFGLGLNFLTTLQAWREDTARCDRLHFVSVEKHPFSVADLSSVLAKHPELEPQPLLDAWPMLTPGMHRLELEQGRVVLTLLFEDITAIRELGLSVDAFYLDGFAPDRNPDMWSPALMRALSRLATPGATAATWSVAASVRAALERTGFVVEKRKGFGNKKEMLLATQGGKESPSTKGPEEKSAIVVGAGIAGAAASERLTSRGWRVTVIERHPKPAMEASGNPVGIFHPVVSPDDSVFARITRASFLYLLQRATKLSSLRWSQCGVVQLPRDEDERRSQWKAIDVLAFPQDYVSYDQGLLFPKAGWVSPTSLVDCLLKGADLVLGREVVSIEQTEGNWTAKDGDGKAIASAPVMILANSSEAARLAPQKAIRLRRVRGQISLIPAIPGLDKVLIRGGFAIPGVDGVSAIGASFDIDDEDPEVRADSHAGNLERLEQLLPGTSKGLDCTAMQGRVAFRSVVPDRLPVIGPLGPDLYGAYAYGSRGLIWAGLGGELLASLICGEPLPLEKKLVAALAPGRFAARAARKATAARA
ncbi:MAG TPA: bifunctional tRNA (5-methylaminomethyl-2-thiouridine)(34)-methyltransferase MnmD/FAD-dependent 5-carboxymethylaminomethyl-2-thiouridine(34) oxidoreductase MnmC [Burkholderiales bacterium]|jgi:tRNA 5-methylaminomethyl-2-thiouridine biosynthesis bifunctional protein|nr:bifunctional tRNA (5-methylaminomethyl-2-thiouridine)(34)-methyltransferase MnmD/FAD-dependent 5-carboxymethylaminomethyl-2-thiouridine(34) oxidoreductase MnmC [Burkholderiales bacterium]